MVSFTAGCCASCCDHLRIIVNDRLTLVLCVCAFYILLTPVSEELDIEFTQQTWIVVSWPMGLYRRARRLIPRPRSASPLPLSSYSGADSPTSTPRNLYFVEVSSLSASST